MKLKRFIAIFAIVAMMATMLFGCSNTNDSKTTAAPDAGTTAGSSDEATTATPEFSYPMEGNPTITIWSSISNNVLKSHKTLEERPYAIQLMKNTGINIDWINPSSQQTAKDEFGIMLSEGNYTDIFSVKGNEAVRYHEDGVIVPLNEIIDQYMPNFKAYLEANPDDANIICAEDGNYYYVPIIFEDQAMGNTYGAFARQDWMTELGIEMPTTIDEWHDALVKVKEEKKVYPIVARGTELFRYGAFAQAFCPDMTLASFYYAEDGEVYYIPASDGYRDYLRTLKQWYAEGLIDPDFISMSVEVWRAKMAGDEGFVSVGYAGSGLMNIANTAMKSNPNFLFTAVPTPSVKAGEEPRYQAATARISNTTGGFAITTKCKNVEAAARYLDYAWSEEGYMLNNYGIEGTSYTMVDGVPTYTDLILKNPNGLAVNEAKAPYMINFEGGLGLQALNNLKGYYSATPGASEAMEIWASKGTVDHSICMISQTLDEAEELAIYSSDISKYMTQCRAKFVTGEMDIETQWEEYLTQLDKLGLKTSIRLKQAALDRYLAQ